VVLIRVGLGADALPATSATNSVTATLESVSGTGTLLGTKTVAAVSGVASFTDLAISGVGVFNLVFTSPGLTGTSIQVTIVAAAGPVASVNLSPLVASLRVGQAMGLIAGAKDANGVTVNITIAWTSSDPAVATVSSAGVVTGVAAGHALITASAGGKSATAAITVTAATSAVASVDLSPLVTPRR
jgi:hypothetical protein